MKFDFKITTWERVVVGEGQEDTVLAAIRSGAVTCSNDIFNLEGVDAELVKTDPDTVSQMTMEDNNGDSTIEVLNDEGETVYTNDFILKELNHKEAWFSAGDRVEVTGNSNSHNFEIGSVVTIKENSSSHDSVSYLCRGEGESWHVLQSEMKKA